ncbi:MAG TPA: hypothetical protein VJM15_03175 [Sphingomicrobium sp.]|nr:hypothetical protein [Sphingomicrobium sp.]
MYSVRPAIGLNSRRFGKRLRSVQAAPSRANSLAEDIRLFAMTFAAGFLFISLLIA